ncbi:MAG: FAD-binding oxidoreductase [Pseudomonas sp.]
MDSDVLVLGAGMVGVSTALALQQRGLQVALVDRNQQCQETSYGNAGIIQREAMLPYGFPRDWRSLLKIALGRSNDVHYQWGALLRTSPRLVRYWANSAPSTYRSIAQAYGKLIEHSLSEHEGWIRMSAAQDLVTRKGWLQAYRTRPLLEAAGHLALENAERFGLGCEVLDPGALARTQPALRMSMAGAIHWKDPWSVSAPGELVDRYVRLFRKLGGQFLIGDAQTLRQRSGGWAVKTASETIQANHAVLALGPWSELATQTLGYRLPLFVKRGYHRHYHGRSSLTMPMLDVERGVMLAPMKLGVRISTGAEFADLDAPATPVQLNRAERSTRELFDLGQPVEQQAWLGARPCTTDMKPIIGAAPRHAGLWFNFGHAHQGFTLGPASGRLLAELIRGEPCFVDPAPYSPARF